MHPPPNKKRKTRALSTHVVKQWRFIYIVTSRSNVPVYVGQTGNEPRRIAAHQQEASKCKRLAQFIRDMRDAHPDWKFADHYSRVAGLEHGVPADEANLWEAYLIRHCRPGGTLWGGDNHDNKESPPCNLSPGVGLSHVSKEDYDDCGRRLEEALREGRSVFSADQRVLAKIQDARADSIFLDDLVYDAENMEGEKIELPEVRSCLDLALRSASVECNAVETKSRIEGELARLSKQTVQFDKEEFAKFCNHVKDKVRAYKAHLTRDDNMNMELIQHTLLSTLKWAAKKNGNGEPALRSYLCKSSAIDILKRLKGLVVERERATGMPFCAFNALMAWANPSTRFVEPPQQKLKRIEKRLAGQILTADQERRASAMRARLRAAIEAGAQA